MKVTITEGPHTEENIQKVYNFILQKILIDMKKQSSDESKERE